MPKFALEIDKDTYESSGSKFINVGFDLTNKQLAARHLGDQFYREIECGMIGWDTPGKSMKVPVVITDEKDNGMEDKISFGVDAKSIWKGKDIYKAITGSDMPFEKGGDGKLHPVVDSDLINGKVAVGVWTIQKGTKGGVQGAEDVYYPKLTSVYPNGYRAEPEKSLGI